MSEEEVEKEEEIKEEPKKEEKYKRECDSLLEDYTVISGKIVGSKEMATILEATGKELIEKGEKKRGELRIGDAEEIKEYIKDYEEKQAKLYSKMIENKCIIKKEE